MRNQTFDIMKGIGIIAVIIGHCQISNIPILRDFIYAWHMPLFFIISGYFHKKKTNTEMFGSNVRSLLLPYFATALFMSCFALLTSIYICSPTPVINSSIGILVGSGVPYQPVFGQYFVGAIWFLLALFWCKTLYNILDYSHLTYIKWGGVIFSFSLSIIVIKYIFLPSNILQGMNALLYYALGHTLRTKSEEIPMGVKLIIPSIILLIIASFYGPLYMVECYYPNCIINLIGAIAGFYVIYCISLKLCNTKYGSILSLLGTLSILILCIHIIDLNDLSLILKRIIKVTNMGGYYKLIFEYLWHISIPITLSLILYKKRLIRYIYFNNR